MEKDSNCNVMMEILEMEMDVAVLVKFKLDGLVQVEPVYVLAIVSNLPPQEHSSLLPVQSMPSERCYKESGCLTFQQV